MIILFSTFSFLPLRSTCKFLFDSLLSMDLDYSPDVVFGFLQVKFSRRQAIQSGNLGAPDRDEVMCGRLENQGNPLRT